jgi:hypothetical protein
MEPMMSSSQYEAMMEAAERPRRQLQKQLDTEDKVVVFIAVCFMSALHAFGLLAFWQSDYIELLITAGVLDGIIFFIWEGYRLYGLVFPREDR